MAITYPLIAPAAPAIRRIGWRNRHTVAVRQSPYSLVSERQRYQGQVWAAEVQLPPMRRAAAEAWVAMRLALDGPWGTFLLADPDSRAPRGPAGGAPLVDGAGHAGQKLPVKGWPVSSVVLYAGDLVQIGSGLKTRMHKTLTDTATDATGRAVLDIWPRLREAPADNEPVVTRDCGTVFHLVGNVTDWDVDDLRHYGMTFGIVEAI